MDLDSEFKPFFSIMPDIDRSKENARSMEVKTVIDKLKSENRNDMNTPKKQSAAEGDNGNGHVTGEEDPSSRKRKRECCKNVVDWIRIVAIDPCSPDIAPLPEKSKWKSFGSELPWKQILLARDAFRLKKNVDKNQKMLPSMYDDDALVSKRLRSSQRLVSAKDPSSKKVEQSKTVQSPSDSEENDISVATKPSSYYCFTRAKKKIPLGPLYQAVLPEPSQENYQNDPKWLGTQIWPLNKAERSKNYLIERDPIGKGRQDYCGCQSQGSIDCVRFHIGERRKKMKLELGSAYYMWRLNCIGEEVAISWTKEDELKFEEIVKSNCLTSEKYFWDELFRHFCNKGREALVSYYFNVFLLRRRARQNRSGGYMGGIYSDDEESEYGPVAEKFGRMAAISPGSIFSSPKKSSYMNT